MQSIQLTRDFLQLATVDAIGYGAKDTGEMGGGAAAGVLTASGPELLSELRTKLAHSRHRIGDVVVTPSFKLRTSGIQWILHIISIIKHTPQGAYCPEPERLREGVTQAVRMASQLGAGSVALSALGTGEGRVDPKMAARLMLDGVKDFWRSEPATTMNVTFCLPSYRDYEAFAAIVHNH